MSHTNAFQSEYAWGKQVLMHYTNKRGDKLQMMLTYPADYQPGKKYPMVVYYYEKLSQGFHQYVCRAIGRRTTRRCSARTGTSCCGRTSCSRRATRATRDSTA